mmetsp:Transcript_13962/g.43483  ORF Transcript_13962/g.43483 Transcript_13962/m.43483 type:complete len:228 (-) Transcript_13962:114-797(-)
MSVGVPQLDGVVEPVGSADDNAFAHVESLASDVRTEQLRRFLFGRRADAVGVDRIAPTRGVVALVDFGVETNAEQTESGDVGCIFRSQAHFLHELTAMRILVHADHRVVPGGCKENPVRAVVARVNHAAGIDHGVRDAELRVHAKKVAVGRCDQVPWFGTAARRPDSDSSNRGCFSSRRTPDNRLVAHAKRVQIEACDGTVVEANDQEGVVGTERAAHDCFLALAAR